jgi:hypothetical protein
MGEVRVYVDHFPPEGWGRWGGGGHMLSNNIFALHDMANKIGLKRQWFQQDRFYHYDLTAPKRLLAIDAGAITIGFGVIPADVLVRGKHYTFSRYGDRRRK